MPGSERQEEAEAPAPEVRRWEFCGPPAAPQQQYGNTESIGEYRSLQFQNPARILPLLPAPRS